MKNDTELHLAITRLKDIVSTLIECQKNQSQIIDIVIEKQNSQTQEVVTLAECMKEFLETFNYTRKTKTPSYIG